MAITVVEFLVVTGALAVIEAGRAYSRKCIYWVHRQVEREAATVQADLKASHLLLLSSPELQDRYYKWMGQIPAVRWHPWLVLGLEVGVALRFYEKDVCTGFDIMTRLPAVLTAAARLALEIGGGSKKAQSLLSILYPAYLTVAAFILLVLSNPCYLSLSANGKPSVAGHASLATAMTITTFIMTPCTMQDFPLLCWITGIGVNLFLCTQHLQQSGGLSLSTPEPEKILGFFSIALSTVASLLLVAGVRFLLAKRFMMGFLRSMRPERRN